MVRERKDIKGIRYQVLLGTSKIQIDCGLTDPKRMNDFNKREDSTMTEAEKYAKELIEEMLESLYNEGGLSFKRYLNERAKECAKIAVKRIIAASPIYHPNMGNMDLDSANDFFEQVLTAIDNY